MGRSARPGDKSIEATFATIGAAKSTPAVKGAAIVITAFFAVLLVGWRAHVELETTVTTAQNEVRAEVRAEVVTVRADVETKHAEVLAAINALRETVVEWRLDIAEGTATKDDLRELRGELAD